MAFSSTRKLKSLQSNFYCFYHHQPHVHNSPLWKAFFIYSNTFMLVKIPAFILVKWNTKLLLVSISVSITFLTKIILGQKSYSVFNEEWIYLCYLLFWARKLRRCYANGSQPKTLIIERASKMYIWNKLHSITI